MTHVCISRETSQDKSCAGTEHDCLGGIQYYSYVYVIMHYLMCQCCMFVVYVFVCIYFVSFMFFGTQYYSITVWHDRKGRRPDLLRATKVSSAQVSKRPAMYIYIYIMYAYIYIYIYTHTHTHTYPPRVDTQLALRLTG